MMENKMKMPPYRLGVFLALLNLFITPSLYAQAEKPVAQNPSKLERAVDRAQMDLDDLIEDTSSAEARAESKMLALKHIHLEVNRMSARLRRYRLRDKSEESAVCRKARLFNELITLFVHNMLHTVGWNTEDYNKPLFKTNEYNKKLRLIRDRVWPPPPKEQ